MAEIWKDIDGYEGSYQVSNLGRVRSLTRTVKTRGGTRQIEAREKVVHKMKIGYVGVNLSLSGKNKLFYVHRLVAQAFIDNPTGKPQVNHKDFNRENNNVDNLEWVTYAENNKHAWGKRGREPSKLCTCVGEEKPNSVLTNEQAKEVVRLLHDGVSPKKISEKLGASIKAIYKISQGKNWKHLGLNLSKCRDFKKRLSDEQVAEIRKMYKEVCPHSGRKLYSAPRLAPMFNVGKTTIYNVIHGKNYPL